MKKKLGIGTIALILSILGIFLSITFNKSGICYGDNIVKSIGLKAWSNGNEGSHYTVIYMSILYIPAIILGFKFNENWGAKLGRLLAIIMLTISLLGLFLSPVTFK